MNVVFDMQDALQDIDNMDAVTCLAPIGPSFPALKIEQTEDVKSIRIHDRLNHEAGMGINICAISGVQAGDRITLTGRVANAHYGAWGIALLANAGKDETAQLAHALAPRSIFALSYILMDEDLNRTILIQTTRWGAVNPIMDVLIDNILIFRGEEAFPVDPRHIVYSLERDPGIQDIHEKDSKTIISSNNIRRAGTPTLKIFRRGNFNAIHVSSRYNDWDGVDISLENLKLLPGNSYQITVTGRVDGTVPKDDETGARLMFQGMPDYSWRDVKTINDNEEFTLSYTLTRSEIENWKFIRITSDKTAATVSFYIYGITIINMSEGKV